MNEESVTKTVQTFRLPSYTEIPDVGLYLDQVVKYINSFLTDFPEMLVTPSMVSNYVKMKIISSPHKKTYSRDQVAGLFFVVCVKTVLSMDHIRECLRMVPTFESNGQAYAFFSEHLQHALESFGDTSIPLIHASDNETETALGNIVIAVAHKMYLERYFEHRRNTQSVANEKK